MALKKGVEPPLKPGNGLEVHSIDNLLNSEGFESLHKNQFFEKLKNHSKILCSEKLLGKYPLEDNLDKPIYLLFLAKHPIKGAEMRSIVELPVFQKIEVLN